MEENEVGREAEQKIFEELFKELRQLMNWRKKG